MPKTKGRGRSKLTRTGMELVSGMRPEDFSAEKTELRSPTAKTFSDENTDQTRGHLVPPHGGYLLNLLADAEGSRQIQAASRNWPSWELTPRQLSDLELLLSGGFSPLRGFLTRSDYEASCASMRLANGTL